MINGLLYLHNTNNGIIHGNMKPSNILIDAVGNIRLADFGITDVRIV
jgi:serine/threonine protein kinase